MIIEKQKFQIYLMVIGFILLLSGCSSSNARYEKDLSSIFNIPLDSNIEDIIAFETDSYDHFEYDLDIDGYGRMMLGFAPYAKDNKTYHKHIYRFDSDTGKLQTVEYGTIGDMYCHDGSNICGHVEILKNAVLDVSPSWDERESDGSRLTMCGNISGTKCKITYFEGIELVTLSVDD